MSGYENAYCKCVVCGVSKLRVPAGKYESGRPRYVDGYDMLWHGYECPKCKNRPKEAVAQDKVRFCRKCKEKLPKHLYFVHAECRRNDYNEIVDWGAVSSKAASVGPVASYTDIIRELSSRPVDHFGNPSLKTGGK